MQHTKVAICTWPRLGLTCAEYAQKRHGPFRCAYQCACELHLVRPTAEIRPYFRRSTANPDTSGRGGCGGGESEAHLVCKSLLKECFGRYNFVLQRCDACDTCEFFSLVPGMEVRIECTRDTFRYDAGVYLNGVLKMALEVYHKHKTGEAKVSATRQKGIELAEFTTEDISRLQSEATHPIQLDNLQAIVSTCPPCQAARAKLQLEAKEAEAKRALDAKEAEAKRALEAKEAEAKAKEAEAKAKVEHARSLRVTVQREMHKELQREQGVIVELQMAIANELGRRCDQATIRVKKRLFEDEWSKLGEGQRQCKKANAEAQQEHARNQKQKSDLDAMLLQEKINSLRLQTVSESFPAFTKQRQLFLFL